MSSILRKLLTDVWFKKRSKRSALQREFPAALCAFLAVARMIDQWLRIKAGNLSVCETSAMLNKPRRENSHIRGFQPTAIQKAAIILILR